MRRHDMCKSKYERVHYDMALIEPKGTFHTLNYTYALMLWHYATYSPTASFIEIDNCLLKVA